MRVFVTGATGFIGSRIVPELIGAGHQVLGLTRTDSGARWLEEAGAMVHRGSLEEPATLASGAAAADAVIHTAFDHDFSRFVENCEKDRCVIGAMAEALAGSDRPLIEVSRAKRLSAYVGDGANSWPAAHVTDVARLYRLALERHEAGARYHAVAEEGVSARAIAEVVGDGLGVPVKSLLPDEAEEHFGWLAMFTALDMPASSLWTRQRLDWNPTGRTLIADLKEMDYGASAEA